MSYNIAIDGPAGAGKSTIARKLADKLSFIYVDTGSIYRAMALFFLRKEIKPGQEEEIRRACREAVITIRHQDGEQRVILNGEDVSPLLRSEEVGNMASAVSVYPSVREHLLELQQRLARSENVVMDGRDIGTQVLPAAQLKIYLTAAVSVRAGRRFRELQEKGIAADIAAIEQDIRERDHRDMTRAVAPLVQAEDAFLVDSSKKTIDEVVSFIIELYSERENK